MKRFARCLVLTGALVGTDAFAATFTVTVTNAFGPGSLQQAILDANANAGADVVAFAIPGPGPHIISPTTAQPLPSLTDTVTIDGYTETDATPNTLSDGFNGVIKIQLDGLNAGSSSHGLRIASSGNIVRGLSITRFGSTSTDGITIISGANNNLIEGNLIGVNPAGVSFPDYGNSRNGITITSSSGNIIGGTNASSRNVISDNSQYGIYVQGSGTSNNVILGNIIGLAINGSRDGNSAGGVYLLGVANNTIGGLVSGARNVISGNEGSGIRMDFATATNNLVQGNFIGTDFTGTLGRHNLDGILLFDAPNNIIGGTNFVGRNVISGNFSHGVRFLEPSASGNRLLGNFIGTDVTGTLSVSNRTQGVVVQSSGNRIGSVELGSGNVIAFNGLEGVLVLEGTNNSIRGNSIFSNQKLGIDLDSGFDSGVTANDPGDVDIGRNNLQNFPMLTNAIVTRNDVTIQGTLNSRPATIYQLDFYANTACDSSGHGEGQIWLATAQATTDASGNISFSAILSASAREKFITATATDPDGNTSEFSACAQAVVTIPPLTFTVTNTNDSGPGSLRQALLDVDSEVNFGRDTIAFNIPGNGVKTIFPLSPLPTPDDPVLIDGYTQTGTIPNTLTNGNNAVLKVRLDGSLAGSPGVDGLHFTARSNIVRGLCIVRFSGDGIEFENSGGNVVQDVWLGLDIPEAAEFATRSASSATDSDGGNGGWGLYCNDSDNDHCDSGVFSGSGEGGLQIDFSGAANSVVVNCSATDNNGPGFSCNADDVDFTRCSASDNEVGFEIGGHNNVLANCATERCADGARINGNNNEMISFVCSDVTLNGVSIESGSGNDIDFESACGVLGEILSVAPGANGGSVPPTDVSIGVKGSGARCAFTIPGTVSGTHAVEVLVRDTTPPVEGCSDGYRRACSFTVGKSSSALSVNQIEETDFPILPGDEVLLIVTSINGSAEPSAAVAAVFDENPDGQTMVMPFTPNPLRVGDIGRADVQVVNNGFGEATDVWVNISSTTARVVDVSPPAGGFVIGPQNGIWTVSLGGLAAGEAKIISCEFIPPPSGSFSLSGTTIVNGQTDAKPSNNTGSRSGSVSAGIGSPAIVTHGDSSSAGTDADPISLLTGELFNFMPADLNIGGPMPLEFSRYYGSFLKRLGRTGALGDNWRHNFEWTLTNRTTTVDVVSDVGRLITFTNDTGNYLLIGKTDIAFQLRTNGSNFVLGDPRSQRLYTFNGSGKLTQIADGHGNAHTLVYTGNNLTSVSDGLGRALTFQYSGNGFLTNISDGARSVAFTQSGDNLASVRDPLGFIVGYNYNLTNANSGLMTNAVMPEGNIPFAQTFDASGRVATQTEAGTNTYTLTYAVNLTTMTDPLGRTRRNVHTPTGELLAFTDESNQTLGMNYNANRQRIAIADRLGNLTRLGYHAPSGNVSAITNTDGTVTTFSYTNRTVGGVTFFDLARITYPDGATESFARDSNGNVLTRTDRAGNAFTFTYNARGQMLTAQNPFGGVVTFTYHANGMLASRTDSETGTTTFAYDTFSRLTNVVHPDGTMLKAAYDANDRLTSITDERNNTSTFGYDDNGNLISATDPLSQTAQFAYDARDRLLQTIDRLGKASSISYDKLNQIAARTDRNGNVTQFTYDTRRRMTSITDAGNQVWNFGYDNEALLILASNPLNQTNRIGRDLLGYTAVSTNALGQSTSFVRDSLRRVTVTVDALSRTNEFDYDSRGFLTNTLTPVIGSTAYARNSLGLLSRIAGLNGEQWRFAYTPMGRRQSIADPLNRTNRFTYDNRGRSAVTTFADGTTRSNSYDQAGNVTRRFYSAGPDLQYAYDALNRVVSANNLALAYDAESRVTNTTSSGLEFRASHDAGGRLTNVTYNGGLFSVTYTYDSRNRLVGVSDTLTATVLSFTYDNVGRLTGATRPNGVNGTYTYDAAGRLTRIQEGTIIDLQYGLDAAAQVTNLNYTMPLEPTNFLSASISNWTYDAAHQINNSGYSYDAHGRQTAAPGRTQQYDGASRITQINSATLGYNGFSDVITRAEGGVTTRYFYNHALGLKPIVAEKNENTGLFRYYIWSPGGRLLYMIDHGNVVRHFHFDRVGSTLVLTDAGGAVTDSYAYTPYGELLGRTGTNPQPFLYVGRFGVRSEPGAKLYHMRARFYDPVTARFLTRDPIWPVIGKPMSLDPYQYVEGNPLSFIDPSGLQSIPNYDGDYEPRTSQTSGLGGLQEQLDLALTATGEDDPVDPIRVAELRQQIEDEKKRGSLVPDYTGPLFPTGVTPRSEKVQLFMNRVSTTRSVMHGIGLEIESILDEIEPAVAHAETESELEEERLPDPDAPGYEPKPITAQQFGAIVAWFLSAGN